MPKPKTFEPMTRGNMRSLGVRDVDATLVQQVFNIPQRRRLSNVHHFCQADDLGAGLDVAENAGVAHPARLAAFSVSGKPIFPLTEPNTLMFQADYLKLAKKSYHPPWI